MSEPRAITFKQVKAAVGDAALGTWHKIGDITGAGHVSAGIDGDGSGSIDLTGVADAKLAQIDGLLGQKKKA